MLESIRTLIETIGNYVSFQAGGIRFGSIEDCFSENRSLTICTVGGISFGSIEIYILIVALATALLSATNLRRIAQREARQDRIADRLGAARDPAQRVRTQGPRWYARFGSMIATSPIVGISEQHRLLEVLAAAGIKGRGDLAAFIASKACAAVSATALAWLLLVWLQLFTGQLMIRLAVLTGALMLGWRFPDIVLSRLAARRRRRIELGLPDALDLMVVCAEAGLSLDQAIEQVGRDLRASDPPVAEEFATTAAEMRVLPNRVEALENLVERTGLPSVRGVTATLSQAIRFGTPLAESMRILAAEMRTERLARLEERAARLPVLLAIPMMMFILPSLLMVIGTPVVLRIIDSLGTVFGKGFP